jgi:hypothetical protein
MRQKLATAATMCAIILAGCSNQGGTIYRKDKFGPYNVLSLDARQRLVLQGAKVDENGVERPIICSEPSPDAITAQAASLAASAEGATGKGPTASGQVSAGFSEAAASIAMRTQTIQLLRDGYFRLCEAYMNGAINREDYRAISLFIDEFIATVVAIEAIGGKVQTAPVAIHTTMNSSVNKDDVQIGGSGTLPAAFPGTLQVNTDKATDKGAEQIQKILALYYERKRNFQAATGQLEAKHIPLPK